MLEKWKEETVFYINALDISLRLGQIIEYLGSETENMMITKFISWREFSNYFKILSKRLMESCSKKPQKDAVMDINPKFLRLIKDVFDAIPREINGNPIIFEQF